jgi:prepilin-type N-terminal cleavage/methylation domain-containing protein
MKNRTERLGAFTLIELLMVIAIVGILAGILIPTVGLVRENANVAASKSQISQYLTAIQSFKSEYGYYPFTDLLNGEGELDLSDAQKSKQFIETLSARDLTTFSPVTEGGNRRRIQFYTFTENEIADGQGTSAVNTVVDRFGNNQIRIVFDLDNNGSVSVPDPEGSLTDRKDVRSSLTAYVLQDNEQNFPSYYLYD